MILKSGPKNGNRLHGSLAKVSVSDIGCGVLTLSQKAGSSFDVLDCMGACAHGSSSVTGALS